METENKEKPTEKAILQYKKILEELLEHQDIRIDIELFDSPLELVSTVNGEITRQQMLWIKSIKAITSEDEVIKLRLPQRKTIQENEDFKRIWLDAYEVQSSLYKSQKRKIDERYWILWDALKRGDQ